MRCETAEQSNRPNEHAQYIFHKYCEYYLKNMVDTVNSPSPSHLQVSVMPRSQAFSINPVTGAVEVVGRVLAGSAFTLTVQVQGHHKTEEKLQGDH